MVLQFTELNVNPHLTHPHFTKQYVDGFCTKALIFVIKYTHTNLAGVKDFEKVLSIRGIPLQTEKEMDYIFCVNYIPK